MTDRIGEELQGLEEYQYGFSVPENYLLKEDYGITEDKIRKISSIKGEPEWMLDLRLEAFRIFLSKPMPNWGADLSDLDFNQIVYYVKPIDKPRATWEQLPEEIKQTYDRLGIPEAERKFLAGVSAQYESEVVYRSLLDEVEKMGVVFTDMDTGLREYGDIVKKYFGKLVPPSDNKFAALNTSVWSGGSFVYIPKGVKVTIPLQAYFRINAQNMGQFERTLIIAEEDSYVHYIEGCFLAGAMVKTTDGHKPIEDIKIGDRVFTHKGRYKRVINVLKRFYTGDIYRVKLDSSEKFFEITEHHPLLVRKIYSKKPTWLLAKDIGVGDYLLLPRQKEIFSLEDLESFVIFAATHAQEGSNYTRNGWDNTVRHASLKTQLYYFGNSSFWEFIGIFLVGGTLDVEHRAIQIDTTNINNLQSKLKIINFLEQFIGKDGLTVEEGKVFIRNASLFCFLGLQTSRGYLLNAINSLDYVYKQSVIKGIKHFLVGKEIVVSSFASAYDLQYLLVNAGMKVKITSDRGSVKLIFLDDCQNFNFDRDYVYIKVEKINRLRYVGFVYNLTVEDDESYVAEGFVSHNCTAPVYSTNSLHSAVVEIFCLPRSRVKYTTVQNWAHNVYNLVTKRAIAYEGATMEWVDGNIGSKRTMKYPSILLQGEGARGRVISVAYAGADQEQDTGTKIFHLAPNTSSEVISKSVSRYNGKTTYRGIISVSPKAKNSKVSVKCDALLIDQDSKTETIPVNIAGQNDTLIEHEASVSRLKKTQIYYLMSRCIDEQTACSLIVNGFIDIFTKELPMEYAVELNRLINLNMEGSVG